MKRQRVRGKVKLFRYMSGGHSVRARLYQQTENIETVVLGESGQCRHCVLCFHISIGIEI